MKRKKVPWLAVLAPIAAVTVLFVVHVKGKARELRERVGQMDAAVQEWCGQSSKRLPVRGDGVVGNAWKYYRVACRGFMDDRLLAPKDAATILRPEANVLQLVKAIGQGALRTSAKIETAEDREIAHSRVAANNVSVGTRRCVDYELQQGRPMRAMEHCFDAAWFFTDVMRSGRASQTNMAQVYLGRLLHYAGRSLLARPALVADPLLHRVDRLLTSLPTLDAALLDRGIWQTRSILEGSDRDTFGRELSLRAKLASWLNRQIYALDMPATLDDLEKQRLASAAAWTAVPRTLDAVCTRESWSALVGLRAPFRNDEPHLIWMRRSILAMLRLLRAAASKGELLGLDPFGDGRSLLHRRHEAGRLILWSNGRDAVDDGGQTPEDGSGFVWKINGKASPDIVFVLPAQ